ncbi:MAG: hypothetical protein ACRD0P_10745, partial [Stackebrandtia sp.]
MLHAKRTKKLSRKYELTEDGSVVTTFSLRGGGTGAQFTLRGIDYRVRIHRFSGVYELLDGAGSTVASTDRVGRDWNLTCSGRVVAFHQAAMMGRKYTMIDDNGAPAGAIRRITRSETTADLPGLDLLVQVFALVVVVLRRRRKQAAALRSVAT